MLRRLATGRRDGEFLLIYEPGAAAVMVREGVPANKIVNIGHPLLRPSGKLLFEEIFPRTGALELDSTLLLVDFLADIDSAGSKTEMDVDASVAQICEATLGLTEALSRNYSQVLIKPHPALGRFPALVAELKRTIGKIPRAVFVEPQVNALALLSGVRAVVGEESSVLKLARYLPGLLIVSVNFSGSGTRRPFHASEAGMVVFDSWRELVDLDFHSLQSGDASTASPSGVDPAMTIPEILDAHGIVAVPQPSASLAQCVASDESGLTEKDSVSGA